MNSKTKKNYKELVARIAEALKDRTPESTNLSLALPIFRSLTSASDDSEDGTLNNEVVFLKAFLQRLSYLKLVGSDGSEGSEEADLSDLVELQGLELSKLDIKSLKNLSSLRSSLNFFSATKCSNFGRLSDLLAEYDESGEPWINLNHLVVSHNNLTDLDASLSLTAWLEIFDASHNQLTESRGIRDLRRIQKLNLGFNRLETIPPVQGEFLTSLSLPHNHLETLQGVEVLCALMELDVGWNLLTHHDALAPISMLPKLQRLSTEGNPISVHPEHRLNTSSWIHPRVSIDKFVLDGMLLTKGEKRLPGMSRLVITPPQTPMTLSSASLSSVSKKRKSKTAVTREAVIADPIYEDETSEKKSSVKASPNKDYLETKRKIEELRRTYGEENWLASDKVHEILGIERPTTSATSNQNDFFSQLAKLEKLQQQQQQQEQQPKQEELEDLNPENQKDPMTASFISVYKSDGEEIVPESEESSSYYCALVKKENGHEIKLEISEKFLAEKEIGKNGKILSKWFVHSVENLEEIRLKEDEKKVIVVVRLTFNVGGDRKREGIYEMDVEAYKALKKVTKPVLEAHAAAAASEKALQCVRCQAVFSQSVALTHQNVEGDKLACPNCQSGMVIEMEKVPKEEELSSSPAVSEGIPVDETMAFTPTHEETEEVEVEEEEEDKFREEVKDSSTPQKRKLERTSIPFSPSSPASQPLVLTSVAVVHAFPRDDEEGKDEEEEDEVTLSAQQRFSRSSSDISVLSNPSQSSIEVLTEKTIKTSALSPAPMMESSSSGSMADSVVTAHNTTATDDDEETTEDNNIDGGYFSNSKQPKIPENIDDTSSSTSTTYATCVSEISTDTVALIDQAEGGGIIRWNYQDYSNVDHRVKLHCELSLIDEVGEEILMIAKGGIRMDLKKKKVFNGVVVISTKKLYILKIVAQETSEELGTWMELAESISIYSLAKLVRLFGGQGVAFHFLKDEAALLSPPPRYYLLFKDCHRTNQFVIQLSRLLIENVRSSPLPVSDVTSEESRILQDRLDASVKETEIDTKINSFLLASLLLPPDGDDVSVSVIITPTHILITPELFEPEIEEEEEEDFSVIHRIKIVDISSVELYDTYFGRVKLTWRNDDEEEEEEEVTLNFVSEVGVQNLITQIREPWETSNQLHFEVNKHFSI